MRAIQFERHGGPEVLELKERPVPVPGRGEILIRMAYAGISRPDKLMRTGVYPWTKDLLPFHAGLYGAGFVADVGSDVTDFRVGERVYVEHPIACGCYAEYKVAPVQFVTPIPEGTDMAMAAVTSGSLIAWGMLTESFPHAEGKTLYIQGAAGSVGTAVTQLAPHLGMRVIASASTERKCEYLRSVGDADVFCYTGEDVKKKVLELTGGKGADIIMDQSVGERFADQLEYLADMGTILIYNNTKGFPTKNVIEAMTDRFGNCPGIRAFSFHYFDDKAQLLKQKKKEVFTLLEQGIIRPHVGARFTLAEAVKAHMLLDSGDFLGSIVLDCAND